MDEHHHTEESDAAVIVALMAVNVVTAALVISLWLTLQ